MSKSKPLESQADAYKVVKDERRHKKESNDKKKSKSKHADAEAAISPPETDGTEPTAKPPKKRKRETLPEEIEVDITLPEPASKKAARKAKKAKTTPSIPTTSTNNTTTTTDNAAPTITDPTKRSTHGVWIGNLPWTATKETLTTFLTTASDSIPPTSITRIHMPAPKAAPRPTAAKPQNRGFAYVDFATPLAQYAAIGLTETQLDGRALLIKDARNFEGRPEKPRAADGETLYGSAGTKDAKGAKGAAGEKAPSRKVFVGNLAFETTREDLESHFGQCGEVVDVHMATFEDSGKSKGFAWVTFGDVEAATAAVNGFVYKLVEEEGKREGGESDDDEVAVPKSRKRKWKLNRLMGRELRCEFAEDSTTRYQKRFGKGDKAGETDHADGYPQRKPRPFEARAKPFGRPFQPKGKVDPRTIKPGAAHANAPRASAAIVKSTGKKTTFE